MWRAPQELDAPTIRYGTAGNINGDGGIAYCAADEIVIGGGGWCHGPNPRYFLHISMPVKAGDLLQASGYYTATGPGWHANCYSGSALESQHDSPAEAYAICLKKQ